MSDWISDVFSSDLSAYVTCFLFALPLIRKLMDAATPLPPVLPLPLGAAMPAVGNRTEFIRGKIEDGRALPFRNQDSAALALLAEAAILVRRDAGAQAVPAGTTVDTLRLDCQADQGDRKNVGEGKGGSARVKPGGTPH